MMAVMPRAAMWTKEVAGVLAEDRSYSYGKGAVEVDRGRGVCDDA